MARQRHMVWHQGSEPIRQQEGYEVQGVEEAKGICCG